MGQLEASFDRLVMKLIFCNNEEELLITFPKSDRKEPMRQMCWVLEALKLYSSFIHHRLLVASDTSSGSSEGKKSLEHCELRS